MHRVDQTPNSTIRITIRTMATMEIITIHTDETIVRLAINITSSSNSDVVVRRHHSNRIDKRPAVSEFPNHSSNPMRYLYRGRSSERRS